MSKNYAYPRDERIDCSKEIRQLQENTIQIPIGPTLKLNANIEKTKNSLKDSRLKHPKRFVCHILTLTLLETN